MSTPLYSSRLYAQNPVFEIIVHEESVKVCTTGMSSAQNPLYAASCVVDISIFLSLTNKFLMPGKFSTLRCTFFLCTPAQIDAPCRLEAHCARNKKCVL